MNARTYLFVPGDRPERFDKALCSGAHAVILDLEDAVQPERKELARAGLEAWLSRASAPVLIRVNALATPWYEADCQLLRHAAVRGVMFPKAQSGQELADLSARLRDDQYIIPLVESVEGVFQLDAIVRAHRVLRLAFGTVDFTTESGIEAEAGLDHVRTQLVLASRRAQLLAPLDGVSLAVDDAASVQAEARHSRRMGMGGKLCIHPRQVAPVQMAFQPSPQEIEWARRVLDAVQDSPMGALTIDGKLVDKPVVLRAQALLAALE